MGGGKKVTVGFRYWMSIHMGIGHGPLNMLKHIKVSDKTAWEGSVSDNANVVIDAPNLFGGDEKEGGIAGTLSVLMGGATQVVSGTVKGLLGGRVPDFRGVATLFFRGYIAANNPYPKPWKFRVARWSADWDLDPSDPYRSAVWYEPKALIYLDTPAGAIHAMNPAHILYQCFTDRRWGRGLSPSDLDDDAFTAAANTLCSEMFGLCLRWNRQSDVNEFIDTVLSHIDAVKYEDRTTGKVAIKLIRNDYDPTTLVEFGFNSGLLEISEDETGGGDSWFSDILVKYKNPIDGSDASVNQPNLAVQQANGDVAATTASYDGLPTAELALRVAARDMNRQAANRRFKVTLDRRGWKLNPGTPFKLTVPTLGLDGVIVRVGTIEDSEITDGRIVIDAVEDFFGLPASGYSDPEPIGAWTPPDTSAAAATVRRVEEATYRDLAATIPDGELAALADDAGLFVTLAKQPTSMAISYDLATAATGESLQVRGSGNWTPEATIASALGYYDTLVDFGPDVDLTDAAVDEAILIDDEIMRVDGFDTVTGGLIVARGCADTLPQTHIAGARAWIYEGFVGTDGRDYATGEDVAVRILTITPSARLEIANAPEDTITIAGRQARPYPPGDLRVNGDRFGELDGPYTGEVTISGADRDRILQDDRLIEHEAADVGPEAGTTYTVRIYDDVTLLRTASGLSSLPWVYTNTMQLSDGEPTASGWWFEVESERGGLVSWQKYRFFVPRRASVILSGGGVGSILAAGLDGGLVIPSAVILSGGEPGSIVVTGNS